VKPFSAASNRAARGLDGAAVDQRIGKRIGHELVGVKIPMFATDDAHRARVASLFEAGFGRERQHLLRIRRPRVTGRKAGEDGNDGNDKTFHEALNQQEVCIRRVPGVSAPA